MSILYWKGAESSVLMSVTKVAWADSRNSTGLLASRVVKETRWQFWVSSSLRQWPKRCLVFCGIQVDSVLISQPTLGILQVREMGIKLGSHLILPAILCCLLFIQHLYTSACSCRLAQGKLWREQEVEIHGLCLLREKSFVAMPHDFLRIALQ